VPSETQSLLSPIDPDHYDIEQLSLIMPASSDFNLNGSTNSNTITLGDNLLAYQQKKSSKTRKVLEVAKRPLKTVGRIVGKSRRFSSVALGYGSTEEGDEATNDLLMMDHANEFADDIVVSNNGIPDVTGPPRHGSFMERVNSYCSGGSVSGPGDGGSTTPRRGSLTGAFRAAVGGSGDTAARSIEVPFIDGRDWVVSRLERYLRQLLLVLIAFIVGSLHAEWRVYVWKALEYVVVAWTTCGILWVMAVTSPQSIPPQTTASLRPRQIFARHRTRAAKPEIGNSVGDAITRETASVASVDTSTAKSIGPTGLQGDNAGSGAAAEPSGTTNASDDELAMLLPKTETEVEVKGPDRDGGQRRKKNRRASKKKHTDAGGGPSQDAAMPHPSLNPFYCMDTSTGERVVPNARQAYVISNEWFDMTMMILIRTPDVDDPSLSKGNEDNELICDYMRDKQRRFEFQYQLKLKKLPEDQKIYFSAELEEPVKMGIIQRAFVGAAMAFIKSTNSCFHYSMAGSKEDPDGRWEKPHMSFPVEMSMDRVVATKPDETPPTLGDVIYEDPESIKARKKGAPVDWNLEDTYTLALWTAYVDFLEWRVINLPGIRPFELNKVIGPQSVLLTLYLIPKDRSAEKHYRRDITQVVELELCNTHAGLLGEHARNWVARSKHQPMAEARSEDTVTEVEDDDEAEDPEDEDEIDDIDDMDDDDDDDEDEDGRAEISTRELLGDETEYDTADAATAAELGEGMYLRSGDSFVLREAGGENDESSSPCFVTNGAGFAILSEGVSSASTIVLQKARRKNLRSRARNELIKSGDTVSVRLLTKGRNRDEAEIRYLSIHRGWWLKWVSTPPKKNGFFTIFTHESEYTDHDPEELRTSETQSAYLTFGGSFWLRHKRWSQYSVGSSAEGSATYGGRVLGLFQPLGSNPEMAYNSDEEGDLSLNDGKGKKRWMKPLQLRAYEASQASMASGPALTKVGSEEQPAEDCQGNERPKLVFSNEDSRLDVPAWVEVMNRTERLRQLAYAVRVVPSASSLCDELATTTDPLCKPFVRLRTGRDLAEIMRVGLSWRSTAGLPPRKSGPSTPARYDSFISRQLKLFVC
jgi:Protein of unknown function (DUF1769)